MTQRNINLSKLKSGYLFPEIDKRKQAFLKGNPTAELISLGIGDTTEPIPQFITSAMANAASNLGDYHTYTGYGPEQGIKPLREAIAKRLYKNKITADDIYISDGAKCDIGRLQTLFGSDVTIGVQDPSYPVYVDGSIIQGVDNIVYMPCTPENNFFPDLENTPRTDLIYFCSPNNPTGATATKEQLEKLVSFAKRNQSIIIYDTAYSTFIKGEELPSSIFEIQGAKSVAIETGSFSKIAGFTGVRLGWTAICDDLLYADGNSVKKDWQRLTSTIFNGASNIAQAGGLAVLEDAGWSEVLSLRNYYMENARLIKSALVASNLEVYGGDDAPYLWAFFPGSKSWDAFQMILEKLHIITTPGSGFGPSGEGFVRFTAFGHRDNILKAIDRLKNLKL